MATVPQCAEQRVVLDGVKWSTYLAIIDDRERGGRITYDRGVLEIMSPGKLHENVSRLLGRMVETFTEVLEIEMCSVASTTCKREDVERGFEADEAYYIQNAAAVASKDELDLAFDPPPDLVIEVDITRSSIRKFDLFHSLGVPELWRYVGDQLSIHVHTPNGYQEQDASNVLPNFPVAQARTMLAARSDTGETQLIRQFRKLIRAN